MIPADLLDQLREKDPELWEKFLHTEIGHYDVDPIIQNDLDWPARNAWLQYCLQEAIRARGWGYAIGRSSKGMTSASVYVPGGEGETVMGYDEAEALLRAYISCVDGD